MLKVSRSRNKIVEPKLLPNRNRNSSFKYFRVVRIEKQIRSFVFWEKLRLDNFCFEIYWPLRSPPNFQTFLRPWKVNISGYDMDLTKNSERFSTVLFGGKLKISCSWPPYILLSFCNLFCHNLYNTLPYQTENIFGVFWLVNGRDKSLFL